MAAGISTDVAALAHGDLLDLRIGLYPYAFCAKRAWELRQNLTLYDAWYVAWPRCWMPGWPPWTGHSAGRRGPVAGFSFRRHRRFQQSFDPVLGSRTP